MLDGSGYLDGPIFFVAHGGFQNLTGGDVLANSDERHALERVDGVHGVATAHGLLHQAASLHLQSLQLLVLASHLIPVAIRKSPIQESLQPTLHGHPLASRLRMTFGQAMGTSEMWTMAPPVT